MTSSIIVKIESCSPLWYRARVSTCPMSWRNASRSAPSGTSTISSRASVAAMSSSLAAASSRAARYSR
ncbi:hypothetical protein Q0F99_19515 [Rathayibacter oskolensis]|uniref:hypothetical protein n=1 Tax=Rathayibacter oskolensis TaxID=1891671 RepID=UPI00265D8937|nr:hypothetical protein [Rathayibacter oskolensis]WKK71515.1 hypothetical protein Q0F99_19515 [Rathayibacter oskolensis]